MQTRSAFLLVVLPQAVLTVEVERVDSSRGAEQVVELGLQRNLCVKNKQL